MKTYRTMRLVTLVCQLGLILRIEAQIPAACIISDTNRPPENSDITVTCGTEYIDLSIYLCPVYQASYNESLMVINDQKESPECFGTADLTADPPVLKYRFPLNESSISSCKNDFKITNEIGKGDFADFSNVQYINISGIVNSIDPANSAITYRAQILYKFSCFYPMHYLLNNTQLGVSGVSLVIRDNNGSFISTLSMTLYQDETHEQALIIPQTGINLKTKIYVAVTATNLTERFNVLLDRCYASTSPYATKSEHYDLFVGCQRDAQTKVGLNGESQKATFSFEAFRFVVHKNRSVSTFYLHCITRLCQVSECSTLKANCETRRKRAAGNETDKTDEKDVYEAMVTSTSIVVKRQTTGDGQPLSAPYSMSSEGNYSSPVVAVIVCIVILTILLVAMGVYFAWFIRWRKPIIQ